MNKKDIKKDRKITTTLQFQDVLDRETGEVFMTVAGTVIKRKADKDGVEILDPMGKIIYEEANFMINAEEIAEGLSNIIRTMQEQALTNQRKKDEEERIKLEADEEGETKEQGSYKKGQRI